MCWPGGEETPQVNADTNRVRGEREAPPLRPRGPVDLHAAAGPGTDESSDGNGRRKDPAQSKEDSQRLVLDNPLAL